MLRRFLNIREELLEIHDSRDGDIEIDDTTRFQGKVIKYTKMLRTIDIVTKMKRPWEKLERKEHRLVPPPIKFKMMILKKSSSDFSMRQT